MSTKTIVNVLAEEFRFGPIILVENLIFDATNEKVGVARSHFGTHSDTVDLFVWLSANEKQKRVKTSPARRNGVSQLSIVHWWKKTLAPEVLHY